MSEQERLPDRLARRDRDVPVPEPDTPGALVATLAYWGGYLTLPSEGIAPRAARHPRLEHIT